MCQGKTKSGRNKRAMRKGCWLFRRGLAGNCRAAGLSLLLACGLVLPAPGEAAPSPARAVQPLPQFPLRLEGEGMAVIFIGGFGDEISGIVCQLAASLPPVADGVENRAYYHWSLGRPDALDEGIAGLARQLGEYGTRHPRSPLVLVGHSMGAATALKIAAALPESQKVYLLTLDPADRSTKPERPASVAWWGNAYVVASQSGHDFIAEWGGRWNACAGADVNLAYDGRRKDEAGQPYIHDNAASLLMSRGNACGFSLLDALRGQLTGK